MISIILLLMEEILHQLEGSLSHYLQGSTHPRWCRISSNCINQMLQSDLLFFLSYPLAVGVTNNLFERVT